MKSECLTRIGPLVDGKVYSYDQARDVWLEGETEADFLPYELSFDEGAEGNARIVTKKYLFDTREHKWLDDRYMELSVEESVLVNNDFREEYGIDSDITLLTLDKKFRKILQRSI